MPQNKRNVQNTGSIYRFMITPGRDGLHELVIMERHCPSDTDKYEKHTLKSLLARIREFDLDTLRVRQDKISADQQRLLRHRSLPPKYL